MSDKKRVVILGGGHAGFRAAKRMLRLRKPSDNLEIVIVSSETSEVYHGLMPQIVGGKIEARHLLVSLRHFLKGAVFYNYEVERIDLANKKVFLDPAGERAKIEIAYDYLVLSLGSVTDLSRFPGLLEHGLQTKTIGDVYYLHDHLLQMLERASVEQNPEERRRLLTFLVVGAGFAGIEIGAEANHLLRTALRFYPGIRPDELNVTIISNTDRILPAMNEVLANRATRYLTRKGVNIRLSTTLASATAGSAVLSTGEHIESRTVIVTAGVAPNPVIRSLAAERDRGRIKTDECCRVPGWPGVWAGGDNASVPLYKSNGACPPTALYAFTQGVQIGNNVMAEIHGRVPQPYKFRNFAEVAQLGNTYGLVQLFNLPIYGVPGAIIARLVFFLVVPSWRCRMGLLADWFAALIFPTDVSQMKIARTDTIVPLRFAAGQDIIRQGDPGSRFYIVNSGSVAVIRRTGESEDVLATLGPGKYFGEVALLQDSDRTATVRAIEDTSVLSIERNDFRTLVAHLPMLEKAVSETTRKALASVKS